MANAEWMLTPEKVESVLQETQVVRVNAFQIEDGLRLAKAEAKKMMEWLEGDCTEHFRKPVKRGMCMYCYHALRKEVLGE